MADGLAYELVNGFRMLLTKYENYSMDELTWTRKILSLCEGIFGSDSVAEAFIYLCHHAAFTAWLLQIQLGIPESTAHRVLKRLRALGIIEPIIKLPRRGLRKGGPIPKVWGLVGGGCTKEDVAEAINLHYRSLSPKYRLAQEVAQSMLDNHIRPQQLTEISYRMIIIHIKEMQIPFKTPDIVDLAAQYLHEQGVKVWR